MSGKQFTKDYNKYIGDSKELGGYKYTKTMDMPDGSIYIYNKSKNKFVAITMPSGDDVMFKDPRPIPQDIGGYKKGDVINNIPLSEVVRTILYPYEYPAFTSFYMSGIPILQIGDTLNTATFNWGISNIANVVADSIIIYRGSTPILQDLGTSPVTMDLGITNNTPKQEVFRITATNSKGDIMSMNTSVNWTIPIYYGVYMQKELTEDEIEAMTSILSNSLSSYTFALNGAGYKYIAIPASLITRTPVFKDAVTKFEVPMIEIKDVSITHANGIQNNYTLFRSFYLLNGDVSINIT